MLVCYYRSEKSFNARMLTALTNRLGDVAILLAIGLIVGHSEYIYGLISSSSSSALSSVFALVVIAAITKRAQIPFSS